MPRAKELRKRIEDAREAQLEIIRTAGTTHLITPAKMAMHQSAIISASAELAEISTGRLVRLTWALAFLTAALLGFAVFTYEYPSAAEKARAAHEHYKLQQTRPPKLP